MGPHDVGRALARRAEAQMGLITRAQLREVGLSPAVERQRTRLGALVPVGARTFRVAGAPARPETHVMAACLDHGGVASHRTAAWLHGLRDRPPEIEVMVVKGRSVWIPAAAGPPIRVRTTTSLPAEDVARVGPIPVTSIARTALGLGALVPHRVSHRELVDVISTAVETEVATLRWFWWVLERRRCRGRDGVTALEAALAERSRLGPTESWLEREVLRLLELHDIPLPVVQRVIRRRGRFAARVDFLYEDLDIVVEALGYAFHRTKEELMADTMRANQLTVDGFDVLQVTALQVARHPASVVATVRAALARATSATTPAHPRPVPTR